METCGCRISRKDFLLSMGHIVVTGIQHKREKGNEKREKRSREFDFKRNVYGKGRRHGTDGLVCLAKKERGRLERLSVKVTGPKRRTKKKERTVRLPIMSSIIRGQTSLSPVDIAIGGAFAPVRLDMYSLLGKTEKENNGKKVSAGPHRRSV